jgi:tetratricopeptide (TPR) repeat protein
MLRGLIFVLVSTCMPGSSYCVPRATAGDAPGAPSAEDRALMQKAFFIAALGKSDAALVVFDDILTRHPDCVEALKLRGTVYALQKNFAKAVADCERAILLAPCEVDTYLMCAVFYYRDGKLDDALKTYDRLLEVNPKCDAAHTQRGALRARMGKCEEAVQDFERALTINPKSADALAARGTVRHRSGDLSGAIADYQKAIAIDTNHGEALMGIAKLLSRAKDEKLRDGKRAVEYGKRAVEATRNANYWAFDALASAYAECGKFKEATESADQALRIAEGQFSDYQTIRERRELYKSGLPCRE